MSTTTAVGVRRPVVALLALLAAAALVLVPAPVASAHDSLVSSSPSDGQTVATMPDHIVLTMNKKPVSVGTRVVVRGPDGEVQQGAPRIVKNTVEQDVAAGSPDGRYTVVWRVTSADGHPVSGTFTFTAKAGGTTTAGPATSTPSTAVTTPDPGPTTATTAGQAITPAAGPTSTSTGGSDQGGTSWAVWLAVAVLVIAGVAAAAVRRRRWQGERGLGVGAVTSTPRDGGRRSCARLTRHAPRGRTGREA